ncbi:MAG: DJ-1/PfpI family protein [Comamonas sp.]|uniref:DJ-1/PfpI family protein n=1 Tax=Comamonas sp. TaxID=34028 RepID=UPI002FC7AC2A
MASIGVVLTPGFADWEYALLAGTAKPFYGIDLRFFSPAPGALRSQGGLDVTVADDLAQCQAWQPQAVAVIGGMVWESSAAPDLGAFLHALRDQGAAVAGICGGTLALARAGLLDHIAHTSNSADFLRRNAMGYGGAAHYRDSPAAVHAQRVITAPGTAPVSFTCEVFAAAGLAPEPIAQLRAMLAAEHGTRLP